MQINKLKLNQNSTKNKKNKINKLNKNTKILK